MGGAIEDCERTRQLYELGHLRQASTPSGYRGIGDYHDGAYECGHVSPYTKSAGNARADVFIVLQDWSSHDRLVGPIDQNAADLGHSPELPTNKNLKILLQEFLSLQLHEVFATNLFPFVKPGSMTSRIPIGLLVDAARRFTLPQVDIIRPKLVVCLGLPVFNALERALGRRPTRPLAAAIEQPFSYGASQVWCQAHTGGLGRANRNRGSVDRVSADWKRMAAATVRAAQQSAAADPS